MSQRTFRLNAIAGALLLLRAACHWRVPILAVRASLSLLSLLTIGIVLGPVGAEEREADAALDRLTREWIEAGWLEDAFDRIQTDKKAAPQTVARCLMRLSQTHFGKRNFETSLTILETIVKEHPATYEASLARLAMAEVFQQIGDEEQLVTTLERLINAPRVETHLGVMDASDTRSRASELLGSHYVQTRQWDKALKAYAEWKPTSWCGTCQASMELKQKNRLLLCLVHTNQHAEAARTAWQTIATDGGWAGPEASQTAALVLIRLYEEAGQRDDLLRMLDEVSPPQVNLAAAPAAVVDRRDSIAAEMRKAVRLVQGSSAARLDAFLAKSGDHNVTRFNPLSRRVSAWLMVRDRSKSIPQIVAATRKRIHDLVALAGVLAVIDTPAARNGLAGAAVKASTQQRPMICAIIRAHCSKPDELIAHIERSVRLPDSEGSPSVFVDHSYYFADWPKPAPGSLPQELPDEFVGERR